MNRIAFSEDYIVDLTKLSRQSRLYDNDLDPTCSIEASNLLLCQGGSKIKTISRKLYRRRKSLITSGASNGQTISGAISTGTHGSNIRFGSVQEMVVGIHIVVDGNKSVFIERKSEPITNKSFLKKIGAKLISDDDMFNAVRQ